MISDNQNRKLIEKKPCDRTGTLFEEIKIKKLSKRNKRIVDNYIAKELKEKYNKIIIIETKWKKYGTK